MSQAPAIRFSSLTVGSRFCFALDAAFEARPEVYVKVAPLRYRSLDIPPYVFQVASSQETVIEEGGSMDPAACVARILRALSRGEGEEASWACEELARWLRAGGFVPHVKESPGWIFKVGPK